MLFIDLAKMKIIKDFNFKNESISFMFDPFSSVSVLKRQLTVAIEKLLSKPQPIECLYTIEVNSDDNTVADDEDTGDFLTLVNIIDAVFFDVLCTNERRDREWRLDVPPTLKNLKISMGQLKNAVNYKTKIDKFNLVVKYKDLTYTLCDEKDKIVEDDNFIHSVDELEVLDA